MDTKETNQKDDQDFIYQNMYENRASKHRPLNSLMGSVALGLGFTAFSVWMYLDLNTKETLNQTIRMDSRLILLYDLGGKELVAGVFAALAIMMFVVGIKGWRSFKAQD